MLEIKEVEWRNFMSYGDYPNYIELSGLGQCLVTGEVAGDDKDVYSDSAVADVKKSNGAGKSTVPNVILWTLFGRTMHTHNPGDKVVNWFTGKDCRCRVTFKSGDEIVRTRNSNGKNELIFIRDGDKRSFTSDTLSTAKAQQAELNRVFNLDWELFCGSTFFNQYSKPWMEMADQARRKAIERALHIDRFSYYAKVAKGKCDKIDADVRQKRTEIQTIQEEIGHLESECKRLEEATTTFASKQRDKQARWLHEALDEKRRRDEIELPDIEQLKKKWELISNINQRISDMEKEVTLMKREIASLEGVESNLLQRIELWEEKSGKICSSCEQEVPQAHTRNKIKPIEDELTRVRDELRQKHENITGLTKKIEQVRSSLDKKSPSQTIAEAEAIHEKWRKHNVEVNRLKSMANDVLNEDNPYKKSLDATRSRLEKRQADLSKLEKDIEKIDLLNKHYNYVYKAWNDRTKIKSFIFQDHIPYINSRLKHYLDVFGLDVQIELTPSLGVTSNMWGYEFESGGERKRTDVAFMLAMFDFHEQIYGRQCNVLVLDEVDGRLDDDGIDSLIGIIKNDLAPKVETVLVISHRNMMYDVFPKEIHVKRSGAEGFRGFSQLVY